MDREGGRGQWDGSDWTRSTEPNTVLWTGCPGSNGTPAIGTSLAPIVGQGAFAIELTSIRPSTTVVAHLSPAPHNLPLPGGCTLYVAQPLIEVHATSSAGGTALAPVAIPNVPALSGAIAFAQGLALDPGGAFLGLLALSPGLRLLIGD